MTRLDLIRQRTELLTPGRRRCSRCRQPGHQARTCPLGIAGTVVAPDLGELEPAAGPLPLLPALDDLGAEEELDFDA